VEEITNQLPASNHNKNSSKQEVLLPMLSGQVQRRHRQPRSVGWYEMKLNAAMAFQPGV
jgi:hypothetical protein